jgi:hypothetical protein
MQALAFEREELTGVNLFDAINPDYATHPAYGRHFPPAGIVLHLRALGRLVPWFFFLTAKRWIFGDRLPVLPGLERGMAPGIMIRIRNAPRYAAFVARNVVALLGRRAAAFKPSPTFVRLANEGIETWHLESEQREAILRQLQQPLASLRAGLGENGARYYEESQKWIHRSAHPDLYAVVEESFEKLGLLADASAYLGHRCSVLKLMVQINDERNEFFFKGLKDCGLPDSPTHLMHFDTTYGVMKSMMYLSDVDEKNGPFCYCLGTHQLQPRGWEGLLRRAVDRAGLAQLDPSSRQLFMALPRFLRKKCSFGSDCLNGTDLTRRLAAAEYRWCSKDGDVALFDNMGVHRGGLVREGERRVLFAIIG